MSNNRIGIKAPSVFQKYILRMMILVGVFSISYFLYYLIDKDNIGNIYMFSFLIIALVYINLHSIIEWYNYYSISIPEKTKSKQNKTVDFFTTFCAGEPYSMIEETLRAIKQIKYNHTTYLCDEADDPKLKQLCKELDIVHVTRSLKIDAKAGNINNALKQATGELCVILDPDHVPYPEMLNELVDYFDDETIGYVQSVQAYKNATDNFVAKGAAQQTYQFYGPMMMCMNSYGTVQAIGANCIFRRSALDSIGGHAAGLAEDMHTAMRMHAKGWKSIYVPKVLTRGLVPNTLSAYYKQQLKWSKGSFDLLFHVYFKLFNNFSLRQKIHYALLPTHYLMGIIYLINFAIPIFSLFTGIIPLRMDIVTFTLVGIPVVFANIFIRLFVQRWVMEITERGIHTVGGILQIGTWWIFILGFVYAVIGKKVPYIPTPKDDSEKDPWTINLPNMIVAILSIVAIIYGLSYDLNPFSIVMASFAALNVFFMTFVILMSRHGSLKSYIEKTTELQKTFFLIDNIKKQFWFFRHFLYSLFRKIGYITLFILSIGIVYFLEILPQNNNSYITNIIENIDSSVNNIPSKIFASVSEKDNNRREALLEFQNIKAVVFNNGTDWFKNYHTLTRKEVQSHFDMMKSLGINTIKRIGPSVYDRNVLRVAKEKKMNVIYSFWVDSEIDFVNDNKGKNKAVKYILNTIDKYKNQEQIIAWNISPDMFSEFTKMYEGEELFNQYSAYVCWLSKLTSKIKEKNPTRLLFADLVHDGAFYGKSDLYNSQILGIDALNVIPTDSLHELNINIPYVYSNVSPKLLTKSYSDNCPIILDDWQDRMNRNFVSYNGLVDYKGRIKDNYMLANSCWNDVEYTPNIVKVLKPSLETYQGEVLEYKAMILENNKWVLLTNSGKKFQIEWHLLQTDQFGNLKNAKQIGSDANLRLVIPYNPEFYKLSMSVTIDCITKIEEIELNTPLLFSDLSK